MREWWAKRRDPVAEAALVAVAAALGLVFYGKLVWEGCWFCVGLFAGWKNACHWHRE